MASTGLTHTCRGGGQVGQMVTGGGRSYTSAPTEWGQPGWVSVGWMGLGLEKLGYWGNGQLIHSTCTFLNYF